MKWFCQGDCGYGRVSVSTIGDDLDALSIVDGRNPAEAVMEHNEDVAQMDQLHLSLSFFHTMASPPQLSEMKHLPPGLD
jgi:hypothetical protein